MRTLSIGIFTLFILAIAPNTASAEHIQACTEEYDPVCGISRDGEQKTYGNKCVLDSEHAVFVHEGECGNRGGSTSPGAVGGGAPGYPGPDAPTPVLPPDLGYDGGSNMTPPDSCRVWFDGCNTCRKGPDGYWACTLMACMEDHKPYCREYEGDITQPPTNVYPMPFPDMPVSNMQGMDGFLQRSFGEGLRSNDSQGNVSKIFENISTRPYILPMHLEESFKFVEPRSPSPLLNFFSHFLGGFFGWFLR